MQYICSARKICSCIFFHDKKKEVGNLWRKYCQRIMNNVRDFSCNRGDIFRKIIFLLATFIWNLFLSSNNLTNRRYQNSHCYERSKPLIEMNLFHDLFPQLDVSLIINHVEDDCAFDALRAKYNSCVLDLLLFSRIFFLFTIWNLDLMHYYY